METILLCSDLDRTLIPNGEQEESPAIRDILCRLAGRRELCLAYISGRDRKLVKQAIEEYGLPRPDYVVGDVGSSIYRVEDGEWRLDEAWWEEIGRDWHGCDGDDIVALLEERLDIDLELQPPSKQKRYKVSYFTDFNLGSFKITERVRTILAEHGVQATIIWSRDEAAQCGLLDILPKRADKLQAMRYLMKRYGFVEQRTVFAGDSGNDLEALTSGLQAILVKNGDEDVRREAVSELRGKGKHTQLYLARGGPAGLNGNYAAGVVEGLMHFFPETVAWVEAARAEIEANELCNSRGSRPGDEEDGEAKI